MNDASGYGGGAGGFGGGFSMHGMGGGGGRAGMGPGGGGGGGQMVGYQNVAAIAAMGMIRFESPCTCHEH